MASIRAGLGARVLRLSGSILSGIIVLVQGHQEDTKKLETNPKA